MIRSQLPFLKEQYDVDTVEVFGSYVYGEQKESSDLDVLVSFIDPPGLLEFVEIEDYPGRCTGDEGRFGHEKCTKTPYW